MRTAEDPAGGEPPPLHAPPFFGFWPRFVDVERTTAMLRHAARVVVQREAARRERTLRLV